MTEVNFYENVADELLRFAVIITKHDGKWVFCKHRKRNTLEVPGGHRETAEDIMHTAKRELYEETGAIEYKIEPVCVYSVTSPDSFDGKESFGMLYYADVTVFEKELHNEIEKVVLMKEFPSNWTYPDIQPRLLEEAKRRGFI